jgi:valyl-tRNA synthetase
VLDIGPSVEKPPESATTVLSVGAAGAASASQIEVYVSLSGLADLSIERERLGKEREEVGRHIHRLTHKLSNDNFVAKAPPEVVERERARLAELREKMKALERNLAELGG